MRDQLVNRLLINNYGVKMRNKHAFHNLQRSFTFHFYSLGSVANRSRDHIVVSLISRDVYVTSAVAIIIRYYLPAQLT